MEDGEKESEKKGKTRVQQALKKKEERKAKNPCHDVPLSPFPLFPIPFRSVLRRPEVALEGNLIKNENSEILKQTPRDRENGEEVDWHRQAGRVEQGRNVAFLPLFFFSLPFLSSLELFQGYVDATDSE